MTESKTSKGGGRKRQSADARSEPAEQEAPRREQSSQKEKAHKEQPQERNGDFPVVALGASAGGLDALSQVLGGMPADSGMAFVVVQHLDPSTKSMLPDLLGRHSHLRVVEAEDGMEVVPDRTYVIPPGRYLSMDQGVLRLSEPPSVAARRLPIDFFLRSLASDCQDRSIAVILSGTGTDGTLGVREIKNENGLVIAQEPDTAEHGGMPGSAIDTGLVDFVLAPDAIPECLTQHARRRPKREAPGETPEQSEAFQEILALLRERSGHDLSFYKSSTLVRRISRRMSVNGVDDYPDYARLLRQQPEELDRLFKELLIRVSGFFRDAEAFEALETEVIPKLLEGRERDQPLRIWVPGCSTGEEAYSIAILLRERMEERRLTCRAQVFGTDIDVGALDKARAARYPANIVADVPEQRLQRFFTRRGDCYEVNKAVREMVVFAEQSVIKDPPFSRVDLVSCRNLLIYLGRELQRRVMPLFHYALKPDGYLFLGSSESIGDAGELFEPLDRRMKIFQRRSSSTHASRTMDLPMFLTGTSGSRRHGAVGPIRERPAIGQLTERSAQRGSHAYGPQGAGGDRPHGHPPGARAGRGRSWRHHPGRWQRRQRAAPVYRHPDPRIGGAARNHAAPYGADERPGCGDADGADPG